MCGRAGGVGVCWFLFRVRSLGPLHFVAPSSQPDPAYSRLLLGDLQETPVPMLNVSEVCT